MYQVLWSAPRPWGTHLESKCVSSSLIRSTYAGTRSDRSKYIIAMLAMGLSSNVRFSLGGIAAEDLFWFGLE